jgi:hypothetical protein
MWELLLLCGRFGVLIIILFFLEKTVHLFYADCIIYGCLLITILVPVALRKY